MEEALIWLCNGNGMRVGLCPVGAAIYEVHVPDRHGKFANVALTPASPVDGSYAGATLAPFAGRIANSELRLGAQSYALAPNEGKHQLHGGAHNLSGAAWEVDLLDATHCRFRAYAADGLDGFPGNRTFTAEYKLSEQNRLDLVLTAQTDQPTRVNLSNHAYWQLGGGFAAGSALLQQLCIKAQRVYHNNAEHIALETQAVEGTAFDFGKPTSMAERLRSSGQDAELLSGYNHAFVLEKGAWEESPAALLQDPASGRRLRLYTDQPALRLYSGGYLAAHSCAVALEAEALPNSMGALLTPQASYMRHISWVFDSL
ncbi:MAG: aldose epimerase family protein [Clostridia bacterium]